MSLAFAPDAPLPRQLLVNAHVPSHRLADPHLVITAQLAGLLDRSSLDGRDIAVAVGSRGIDQLPVVVAAVVAFLKSAGGRPFIVPAMGNHGGATEQGQTELLDSLGISPATTGAPVRAAMTTREVARTPSGVPVFVADEALRADGVILVNRVKPHTDFESPRVGSGLLKMCAIGLGKSEGAGACHRAALRLGHEKVLLDVSSVTLANLRVLAALGLVEDGRHQLAEIEVMPGAAVPVREPVLLARARELMPALPFRAIDVLVIDNIGKDISGAGMDTNIIGRGTNGEPRQSRRSDVGAIYARRLTPASHGNAIGLGLADVVSEALVSAMDPVAVFTNALSAMTPMTAKIPLHYKSDHDCLHAAVRFAAADPQTARIVRIRSTLALDRFIASEIYAAEIQGRSDLQAASDPTPWYFDAAGDLDPALDLLA